MSFKLKLRQIAKMLLQNVLLPFIYFIFSRGRVQRGLVIFADAHHDSCPFSMRVMRKKVAALDGVHVKEFYLDFGKCGKGELVRFIIDFMMASTLNIWRSSTSTSRSCLSIPGSIDRMLLRLPIFFI